MKRFILWLVGGFSAVLLAAWASGFAVASQTNETVIRQSKDLLVINLTLCDLIGCLVALFLTGALVGFRGCLVWLRVQARKGRFRDKYEFRK